MKRKFEINSLWIKSHNMHHTDVQYMKLGWYNSKAVFILHLFIISVVWRKF